MKKSILAFSLFIILFITNAQNWTKVSGIADGGFSLTSPLLMIKLFCQLLCSTQFLQELFMFQLTEEILFKMAVLELIS